ncbi:LysE family translocator [Trabulsiella odontotermitis]|uniref:LysE family translocator n=1 Tax=Trabulsiella odontotermitis TaxID=379893 RepID=UPI0006A0DE00|nr:LysE family translocator [Trabulsiella odontotermitis]KNC89933.1 lysine transporter LysE [Trabulsiella odontotermitis]
MQISTEFLITSFIVVVSPGTGTLYTVATGLSQGRRHSIYAATGCTLGIIPHMIAAITGLAAIFHTSRLAFEGIRILGVIWLLYMAWSTLKEKGAMQLNPQGKGKTPLEIIIRAILINLLNPKLPLFFLAFLPQFMRTDAASPVKDLLILSGIFMLMTWGVFALYGVFSAFVRGQVLSKPGILKALRIGFATGFVGLGIKLLLTQQK